MNIEKLTQALATYFREDEDIIRNIIIDNIELADMKLDEVDDMESWENPDFDNLSEDFTEFQVNFGDEDDLTDEELRAEVERIRNNPDWMMDEDAVNQMEGLAREVFDGLSQDERTRVLLDMVLNLCDEIDKLKNQLNNDNE